jgi:hypothetical protein
LLVSCTSTETLLWTSGGQPCMVEPRIWRSRPPSGHWHRVGHAQAVPRARFCSVWDEWARPSITAWQYMAQTGVNAQHVVSRAVRHADAAQWCVCHVHSCTWCTCMPVLGVRHCRCRHAAVEVCEVLATAGSVVRYRHSESGDDSERKEHVICTGSAVRLASEAPSVRKQHSSCERPRIVRCCSALPAQ